MVGFRILSRDLPSSRGNSVGLEVCLERRWDCYCPIELLMSFDQGNEKPGQGRTAAIQQVREFVFAGVSFETQPHTAGLKVFAIRNT